MTVETKDAPLSEAKPVRKNAVKAYGGVGPNGLKTSTNGPETTVSQSYGVNFGLGYERRLSDRISLDSVMLMNREGVQGGLLGVGYNF